MSETSPEIKPEPQKPSRIKALWERLTRKEVNPITATQPLPEGLTDMLTEKVNNEGEKTVLIEIGELKPANKIFFHTTATQNIPAIIQQGLLSTKDRDVIGRDLMYSLTFDQEFNLPNVGRSAKSSDFTLTIWRNSPDIKQVKDYRGKLKANQFGAAGILNQEDQIPAAYLENKSGSPTVDRSSIRMIEPSNFLAAIPINESSQTFLTRCKLEFAYNLATANDIEQRMVEFFSNPKNGVQLGKDYSVPGLAHDLTAKIQQEVLLHLSGVVAKNALRNIDNLTPSPLAIQRELDELTFKNSSVNEPVSKRYITTWLSKCQKAVEIHKPGETHHNLTRMNQGVWLINERVDPYKLWGGSDGYNLALKVARQIGIKDF